mmetsp:Transcript_759/g.1338  ORF Transcript_759/g.1338 Transcript_759/m.1338 type:complete len:273 (-) Transcript_759:58-876(-)
MFLRVLKVALVLQLLRQVRVRLRQQVLPVQSHQPHHLVVLPRLFVHVYREVMLLHRQVHPLRLLQLVQRLQLARAASVQRVHLGVGEVTHGNLVRRLPLPRARVHLHRIASQSGFDVVPLRLLPLPRLVVVARDALVKGQRHVAALCFDDPRGLCPLSTLDRRLDRLHALPGLDEVIDGGIHLLAHHQPVAPLLLQPRHIAGELAARELHGPAERVTATVRLHRLSAPPLMLVKLARLFVHPGALKRVGDRVHESGVVGAGVRNHHRGCFAG